MLARTAPPDPTSCPEVLFAHLKTTPRFEGMRLRGLSGARDELLLAAIVQNLRRMTRLATSPAAAPA